MAENNIILEKVVQNQWIVYGNSNDDIKEKYAREGWRSSRGDPNLLIHPRGPYDIIVCLSTSGIASIEILDNEEWTEKKDLDIKDFSKYSIGEMVLSGHIVKGIIYRGVNEKAKKFVSGLEDVKKDSNNYYYIGDFEEVVEQLSLELLIQETSNGLKRSSD